MNFSCVARYAGALRQAIDGGDWPNVVQLTTRAAKGVQGKALDVIQSQALGYTPMPITTHLFVAYV
jgi:hypothetical protein